MALLKTPIETRNLSPDELYLPLSRGTTLNTIVDVNLYHSTVDMFHIRVNIILHFLIIHNQNHLCRHFHSIQNLGLFGSLLLCFWFLRAK